MRALKDIWADIIAARRIKDPVEYERVIEPLVSELWATEDSLGVIDPRTR